MRPMQPSPFSDKRALPTFVVLGLAWLVFAGVSAILAPFNFDLHHDGYSLTQSWRAMENPALSGDNFFQYGIFYHYVLGGLLFLGDGNPILSRYVAIGLVLSSAAILLKVSGRHRLPVAMALGLWLLQSYWFKPYLQYFVQFHPSQTGLLLFSAVLYVLQRAIQTERLTNIQLILLILFVILCLFAKINFGILLALATTLSLCVMRVSPVSVICFITAICLTASLFFGLHLQFGSLAATEALDVHVSHVRNFGVMKGIENTFWLNPDHGSVLPAYRILLILPCLSLLFAIIGTVAKGADILPRRIANFAGSKDLQIYAIMGLGLWGTIFPTGSLQHLWYGSPILLCFAFLFATAFLRTNWKWLLSSLVLFMGFQNFVSGIAGKYVNVSRFTEVEAGMLAGLRVPPEVNDFLVSVDRLDALARNEGLGNGDCRTVNLTVNGIFVREPRNFCSVDSAARNFNWISDMDLSFTQFENRLSSWQGGIISPTPDLMAVMEPVSQSRVHGQDFGTDNFFFMSRSGIPETDRQQMPARTSESEPAMSVDEWRGVIGEVRDSALGLPDKRVFLSFECGFLRHVKSTRPELPMSVVEGEGGCHLLSDRTARQAPAEIALALTYLSMTAQQLYPVLKPD